MRRKTVSIGNIVIPQDVDREQYVQYAMRTYTACVTTDNGDFIKNCPIASQFCGFNDGWFNAMLFPPDNFTLGTQVVMLNMENHDIPIIIGTLKPKNESSTLIEEYQVKLSRKFEEKDDQGDITKSSYFEIEGKGLKGILSLIVDSTDEDGGKILFDARNDFEKGELCFKTNYFTLYGNKKVDVLSDELINLIVSNVVDGEEFSSVVMERLKIAIQAKAIELNGDSVKIGDGSESLVKGNELIVQLSKEVARLSTFLNTYVNTPPVPSDGGAAIQTAVRTATNGLEIADYSGIKSTKTSIE